jgi:hypothetical protein
MTRARGASLAIAVAQAQCLSSAHSQKERAHAATGLTAQIAIRAHLATLGTQNAVHVPVIRRGQSSRTAVTTEFVGVTPKASANAKTMWSVKSAADVLQELTTYGKPIRKGVRNASASEGQTSARKACFNGKG